MTLKNIIKQCASIQKLSSQIIKNVDNKYNMYNCTTYDYDVLVFKQDRLIKKYLQECKQLNTTIEHTNKMVKTYRLGPF